MLTKLKLSACLLLLLATCLLNAVTLLERFDDEQTVGQLSSNAEISQDEGLERGALKIRGNNEAMQYFYSYKFEAKPEEEYALALNYKTSADFPGNRFLAIIVFDPEPGKPAAESIYFRMSKMQTRWGHKRFSFSVPPGQAKVRVMLRLASVPDSELVWVDHLRLAPIKEGIAKGIDIQEFETSFDQWRFDRHLIYDHFMLGPGASIEHEWREAKVGESFFRATGSEERMQYALFIENIALSANTNYIFEAWLRASSSFRFNGNGILIFFYKDAKGKALGQSRYHIRPSEEWKQFAHSFTSPQNAARLDIGLNMRNRNKNDLIQLDHLRFRKGMDQLSLGYEIDPELRSLEANCYLIGSIRDEDLKSLQYKITSAERQLASFPAILNAPSTFDLNQLEDGAYQIIVEANFQDGGKIASDPLPFAVYNHPDWYNDIGIRKASDQAPAPWKNLKINGDKIETWNNIYTFDKAMQLQGIESKTTQKALLAAPALLSLNGKGILEQPGKTSWKAEPSLVSGEQSFTSEDYSCQIKVSIDYSGFIRYRLNLKALRDFSLEQASLALRLPKADFIHRSDGTWTKVGAVDLHKVGEWSSKHLYNLQFGSLEEGICVYFQKLWPAKFDFEQDWVRAKQNGELLMQLVNSPLQLTKGASHSFEFALCPYPFRPNENNWRKLRFRAGANSNCDLTWQSTSLLKYAGSLLETSNKEALHKYLENKAEFQLIYQIPTYILETIPQWSYFRKKWRGLPARAYDMRSSHKAMLPKGDYREKSWTDLYIKRMVEHLDEFNWDGVYYDCFGVDVFQNEGESSLPVFANRGFHERVYNAQRLKNPNSLTISHVGADQASTLCAYSNVVLMGEQYRGQFNRNKYFLDFLSLDEFRYENVVNIGADRMLLPQYRNDEDVNSPVLTAHFMGMALLHNLMVYPNFIVKEVELRFRNRQFDFGMQEAEFFPYWENQPDFFQVSEPAVKLSYWKNSHGILAVLLNSSKTALDFTVKTDKDLKGEFYEPVEDKTTTWENSSKLHLQPYLPALLKIP